MFPGPQIRLMREGTEYFMMYIVFVIYTIMYIIVIYKEICGINVKKYIFAKKSINKFSLFLYLIFLFSPRAQYNLY